MKINIKKLLLYIIVTFLIGNLFVIFVITKDFYNTLNKPFNVPSIIFPIVWSILYLIMSISTYVVSNSKNEFKKDAIKTYFTQLTINSLWTLLFFGLEELFISFIWILLLITIVISMIIKYFKINKISGIINIPYLIWLIFAAYLNYSIFILN